MTVKEIITQLGGPVAVGRALSVRPQAVSLWCAADRIPLERVPALLRMAQGQELKLTASDLRGDVDWEAVCCKTA